MKDMACIERLRQALALPARRLPGEQEGQSLTELALCFPILSFLVLIAANVGLAVHAHTTLTQATQQAAQYLLNHPANTSSCSTPVQTSCIQSVTATELASFLGQRGFSNSQVTVTFSQTPSGVQKASLSVQYSFPVIAPIMDKLNAGAFHNGTVTLTASASTIAATPAPTFTASYSGGQYSLTITPPANPAGVALRYKVWSHAQFIGWAPPLGQSATTTTATYTDTCAAVACTSGTYDYAVSAVQPDGLESSQVEVRQ